MMRRMLAVALAVLALGDMAWAQPEKPPAIPFEGAEVFCHILFHEDLRPIPSLDALRRNHEDTILIVFGDLGNLDDLFRATGGLGRFCAKGGNLLLVTDRSFGDGSLALGIRGIRVNQPVDRAYRTASECPWLPSASGADHPLFQGLHKGIATNRPSHVTFGRPPGMGMMPPVARPPFPEGLEPLLRFPLDAVRDDGRVLPNPLIYMMGSPKDGPPQGRILVIAGHGMFLNGMMLQADNDNFDFGVNAIRWLSEAPDGKRRSRAMLLVNGKIVSDFNMNLSPPAAAPKPQIPVPPVEALNRLIRGMEEEGLFHKILRGALGDNLERTIGLLLALTTFALLLYGAKKFMEGRISRETSVPVMAGTVAAPPPALSRGQQRNLALHRQTDASGQAAQLAATWLRAEFGLASDKLLPGANVTLQASGFFLFRWRLARRASLVLALARTPDSTRVTRRQFAWLIDALPGLSAAVASGRLALLVDGKNVRQGGS